MGTQHLGEGLPLGFAQFRELLGDGTQSIRAKPVRVRGEMTFGSVTAGGEHTCGLDAGGVAYCWGANANGQLGDGTTTRRLTPVKVAQ